MQTHSISADDDDIRLDRWFKRHHPGLSHGLLEKLLRKGDIRVDGKKAKSSDRVRQGQEIRIQDSVVRIQEEAAKTLKPKTQNLKPEDAKMMQSLVLYKDANVIVINKPFGLAVQGGTGIKTSIDGMLDALKFELPGRPKLVHRLDRDTTGVLVLARNAKAASNLMKAFAGKDIQKTYLALVHGQPEQMRGEINKPIAKCRVGEGDFELMKVDDSGKRAVTEFRVADMLARKFSLMELSPLTGRTHQLRVHMAEIGCPIVGDGKYGGRLEASALGVENKLHLHAWRIRIPGDITGKKIDVTAPPPAHMKASFDALGIDVKY